MMICKRCTVTGRVQGVWFRASTRDKALELGLTGRALNLPDGRVEVLAAGSEAQVAKLCDWLWEGPPHARVENVACETVDTSPLTGFHIG